MTTPDDTTPTAETTNRTTATETTATETTTDPTGGAFDTARYSTQSARDGRVTTGARRPVEASSPRPDTSAVPMSGTGSGPGPDPTTLTRSEPR